ncbi:MAG: hypothetical protein IKX28_03245 [Bacteroidales bacterium]|nr:hypothetical protein [Bacteroidales bacterium]
MSKKTILAILLALPLFLSCGNPARKDGAPVQQKRIPELLAAVPSDALGVICNDRCSEGLRLYDSTSVLHKLDLSDFKNARMALSLCYSGSLMPVLALDTRKAEADSAAALNNLLAQAASLKLYSHYFEPDEETGRTGMVVISPSDAQITAVRRHITEQTSILDAPYFRQALAAADPDNFVIFRNGGADRLAPKGWLQDFFPRRDLTAFLRGIADWTVITPKADGCDILPVQGPADSYFANILELLPFSDSRLGAVLPDTVRFALALPVANPTFREAFERFQDASVKLTRYHRTLDALRKESGKNPLMWEKEIDVRELALVHGDGWAVALVRPGKAVADREPAANPWRGFLPALYGSVFALPDDSCEAAYGGWYVYGSPAGVQAWLDATRPETAPKWPGKGCRFIVYEPEKTLAWGKKGLRLQWNSNQ